MSALFGKRECEELLGWGLYLGVRCSGHLTYRLAEGRHLVPVGGIGPCSLAQEVTLGRSVTMLAIRKTLTNYRLVLNYN
jgi:tetrahydromethanopterin S-methyltransferase subunit D